MLAELNPDVCQALTGRVDTVDLLRQIEARNLFLVALDHERYRYRYHHLFGELLRTRLRAGDSRRELELHQIAGDWFANQGQLRDAVHHMVLARDIRRAIELLRDRVVHDYFSGRPSSRLVKNAHSG